MYTVYQVIGDSLQGIELDTFDNYDDAVSYARNIATEPVYYVPDPEGVYVTIFDDNHDSPRYTSW